MARPRKNATSWKKNASKGGVSVVDKRRGSSAAVLAEEDAQQRKASTFKDTTEAFFAKRPRVLALGIDGICAKDVRCCDSCKAAAESGGFKQLTLDLIASKGALSKVSSKRAELSKHGVSIEDLDAKGATAAMKQLIFKGAFRLHVESSVPFGPVALDSLAPVIVDPPIETADTSRASRRARGSLSPAKSIRAESSRSERAQRIQETAEANTVHVYLRETIATDPKLNAQYTDAFKCCIMRRCIRFSEYRMTGQFPQLEEREWNKVIALTLRYSHNLLHGKYLPLSREDAQRVHDDLRAHRAGMDWSSHWPHGHHCRRVRIIGADGFWPIPGFMSPHGAVDCEDIQSGHLIGFSQWTKQANDEAGSLTFAEGSSCGWKGSSGDMDREGTAEVLRQVSHEPGLKGLLFARDGDVKAPKEDTEAAWRELEAMLVRCSAHALKNLAKLIITEMAGKTCTCTPCCGRVPGKRCKPALGHRVKGAVYYFLREAVHMFLPELRNRALPRERDVGSEERETKRKQAIKWVEVKIIGMVLHYTGECSELCDHDADHQADLKFSCKAQVTYLCTIMKAFIAILPEIITPFGLVHINGLEAKHGGYIPYRAKRVRLRAQECQTGENRGAMAAIQLSVAYWNPHGEGRLYPEFDLADIVKEELGLDITFSEEERFAIIARLEARVNEKIRRDSPEWKASKAKRLQAKARALANREDSSYISGGTAAALSADTASSDPAGLGAAIEAGVAGEEIGDGGSDDDVEHELQTAREEQAPFEGDLESAFLEQFLARLGGGEQ
jgi:hypothetical protein